MRFYVVVCVCALAVFHPGGGSVAALRLSLPQQVPVVQKYTNYRTLRTMGSSQNRKTSRGSTTYGSTTLTVAPALDEHVAVAAESSVPQPLQHNNNIKKNNNKVASPMTNRERLDDIPQFPRTWVPLASTFELDPDRPTPVKFFEQSYVVYRNNFQQWVVMDDSCPHRHVPLSEGRIDRQGADTTQNKKKNKKRETTPEITTPEGRLECAYHGWSFDSQGKCQRVPQVNPKVELAVLADHRSCVASYTTLIERGIVWIWPWKEDVLACTANKPWTTPEGIMEGLLGKGNDDDDEVVVTSYTRDLPYGWETLVENLFDPAHVPFAHHGMQGKRTDAIPINMTISKRDETGVSFQWEDRTMGMMRSGTAEFRAPFVVSYDADFITEEARKFNLVSLCIPIAPGWSRAIICNTATAKHKKKPAESSPTEKKPKKKMKSTLFKKIFAIIPTWVSHTLSNKFLDSDLAFLHYQEQKRPSRPPQGEHNEDEATPLGNAGYFSPSPCDRSSSALHQWIGAFAHTTTHLPPAIYDRSVLFDRYTQHASHCVHCQTALEGIKKWRRNTYVTLALSLLVDRIKKASTFARITAVGCLALLRILAAVEPAVKKGEFQHYKNH